MKTQKLIGKLQENHILYNQNVKDYEINGEEDFKIWLNKEINIYFSNKENDFGGQ